MLDIYADESCKDNHHFFVLGCTIAATDQVPIVVRRIREVRASTRMVRELKWNKVSAGRLAEYKQFVDVYFSMLRQGLLNFHCLIADAHQFDHAKFNEGSAEIGYNKLMYQLLVKAGCRFKIREPFYAYLDDRTTRHGLSELQLIVNRGYCKESGSRLDKPFRRVVFRDSKQCDMLQLNDIIIGAVGFVKNGHGLRLGASPAKIELSNHITALANVASLGLSTRFAANDFRVWNFELRR